MLNANVRADTIASFVSAYRSFLLAATRRNMLSFYCVEKETVIQIKLSLATAASFVFGLKCLTLDLNEWRAIILLLC